MTERINFISFFGSRGTFGPYSLQNIGAWCGPQKREGGRAGTSTQVRTQFPHPKENKCRAIAPSNRFSMLAYRFRRFACFFGTHTPGLGIAVARVVMTIRCNQSTGFSTNSRGQSPLKRRKCFYVCDTQVRKSARSDIFLDGSGPCNEVWVFTPYPRADQRPI